MTTITEDARLYFLWCVYCGESELTTDPTFCSHCRMTQPDTEVPDEQDWDDDDPDTERF